MKIYALSVLLCISIPLISQNDISSDPDRQIVESYLTTMRFYADSSPDSLLWMTASYFLKTPYVASTLEINDNEQLVINLRAFDCMTFVENCLALVRTVKGENSGFDSFCHQLRWIRYRDGVIDGYPSRLHYTSDWITDNEEKQVIADKSSSFYNQKFPINVNFMSTHPESYKHLKNAPEDVIKMKSIEEEINNKVYYYIPKTEISQIESLICDGDIICFTTSIQGLDISHLGIACRKNGILSFIHASSAAKEVIVNPESLSEYCRKIKSNTGIILLQIHR